MSLSATLAAFAALATAPAGAEGWRTPDPQDVLLVETSRDRLVVELEPRLAPRAVERIRLLARRGTYDGLLFHRVIDGFVAQTGNPNNQDGGGTELPDLKAEFRKRVAVSDLAMVRRTADGGEALLGAMPVQTAPPLPEFHDGAHQVAWGAHCAGMVGMGRQASPDSANSELYVMRDTARSVDHDYTAVGRVLVGLPVVRALAVGVPPEHPDSVRTVRVLADLPPDGRPVVRVRDTASAAFRREVEALRRAEGADFSVCDVPLAAEVAP